ncbi:MAG TPA: hypothetical protein VE715_01715 [Blastocatellia bacterium]|nr:hypothetical protein [Blastocatellia bacterium]
MNRDEKARDKPSPSEKRKLAGAFDLSSPNFMGRMSVVDALALSDIPDD